MPKVQVNGIRLFYQSMGSGDPMLLIHGLGSSTRDWEQQIPFFARSYRVITLDLRGHGMSDKPPKPYSMALFASDIAQLLRELDIASAHIVGLSFGGFVGFQLAVDHPDLVSSLIACVIFGEWDFVRKALKEEYSAKLPDAELVVIPGSGHFTPLDASQRFNEAVISFLGTHE